MPNKLRETSEDQYIFSCLDFYLFNTVNLMLMGRKKKIRYLS